MHSYAQTNDFPCPVCGQPFRAEIWLIVDAGERSCHTGKCSVISRALYRCVLTDPELKHGKGLR